MKPSEDPNDVLPTGWMINSSDGGSAIDRFGNFQTSRLPDFRQAESVSLLSGKFNLMEGGEGEGERGRGTQKKVARRNKLLLLHTYHLPTYIL